MSLASATVADKDDGLGTSDVIASREFMNLLRRDLGITREVERGIVHTVRATDAAVADITQLPELLHWQERELFGDQAYWKENDREFLELWGIRYRINRRPPASRPLSERWRMINRARSRTRAGGEHAFRVIKQLWGLHQGALSRPGQESGAGADHVRAGQPLPSPASAAPGRSEVLPVTRLSENSNASDRSERPTTCGPVAFPA